MSLNDWNEKFDKLDPKLQEAFKKTLEEAVEHFDRDLNHLVEMTPETNGAKSYARLNVARIRIQIIGIIRKLEGK